MVGEIKAKLVLDTSGGIAGAVGSSGSSSNGGMGKAMFDKVTIPITDVLGAIAKGIGVLVRASPVLAATMKEFGIGIRMALMPIAETISTLLRPWIMKFNRIAFKFYDDYVTGGLMSAFKGAMSEAFDELGLGGTLAVASILTLGAASLNGIFAGGFFSGLATFLGLDSIGAAATALAIPAIFTLTALTLATAFGFDSMEAGLIALVGLGAYAIGGLGLAIPVALALTVLSTVAESEQKHISKWLEDAGFVNPKFDGAGISAGVFIDLLFNPDKRAIPGAPTITEIKESAPERLAGYEADPSSMPMMSEAPPEVAEAMRKAEEESKSIWTNFSEWWTDLWTEDKEGINQKPNDLGIAMETATDEKVVPSFDKIWNAADKIRLQLVDLSADLYALPDIERTITYKVRYET